MNLANKKVFWVEKIALTDILRFLAQSCFGDIRINYDRFNTCPSAIKFLGFLGRAKLNRIFFPVELTFGKMDADGYALEYKAEKELGACIDDFLSRHVTRKPKRFKDMLKSYIAGHLRSKVVFITMVTSEIDSGKTLSGEKNVIYLKRDPFNYLLCKFYRDRNFAVHRPVISMAHIMFYFKPFYYLSLFMLCRLSNAKIKSNISDIRPAIWVEYYPNQLHSFWMDIAENKDFDIVNYLDRNDTPVTPETIKEIESHNSRWIDAHLPALMRMSKPSFPALRRLFSELFLTAFSKPAWLNIFRFEYSFFLFIYESVFLRYKVKVLLQHQDTLWKQEVQALAIERAGGIMVGYHWSLYYSTLLPTHLFPQHVYFVWGKVMRELLMKKESACRHVLPSGVFMVPDGRRPGRLKIFDDKINFVISIFDNAASYDLHLSPASLSEFYIRLLTVVRKNPGFGCIIKSKFSCPAFLESLPSSEKIMKLVEELTAQGRLAIFDCSETPIRAGLLSNLSVGYGISSACAVSVTNSGPAAVNWDCAGMGKHPVYKCPDQKFVFKTMDELEEAILKASEGDKSIGDYGRWKKHINYFEDSLAVDRVVNFLESYMKESINTGDPEHSLGFAVKKYLVDNKVGEDFFQKEGLWEDE